MDSFPGVHVRILHIFFMRIHSISKLSSHEFSFLEFPYAICFRANLEICDMTSWEVGKMGKQHVDLID